MVKEIFLKTTNVNQAIDITQQVQAAVPEDFDWAVMVYVPHTTAWVTINEGWDPAVAKDLLKGLDHMVPYLPEFEHLEGNSPAHIKSSLVGVSQLVMVTW